MINRLLLILRLNIQHEKEMCEKCFSVFSISTHVHTHVETFALLCVCCSCNTDFYHKALWFGVMRFETRKTRRGIGYSNAFVVLLLIIASLSPSFFFPVAFAITFPTLYVDILSLLKRKTLIATNTDADDIQIGEESCRLVLTFKFRAFARLLSSQCM